MTVLWFCLGRRRVAAVGRMQALDASARDCCRAAPTAESSSGVIRRCIPSNSSRSSLRMWDASFSTRACKSGDVQFAGGGAGKKIAQQNVPGDQFLDQGLEFGKARSHRKQLFFFGGKMKGDLLFEDLLNFRLPCFQIDPAGLNGAIQAHAQRQAMLVLVGERNQVLVTKHVYLFSAQGGQSATKAAPGW